MRCRGILGRVEWIESIGLVERCRKMRTELEPILALYLLNQPEQFSLHLDCVDGQLVVLPEQAKA